MIQVDALTFSYHQNRQILDRVGFRAEPGHCVAVLGNNGAGKSTMIKCIDRILKPDGGVVTVGGKNVGQLDRQELARDMAYVSQKNDCCRFTVYDAVLLGRKPYITLSPADRDHEIVSDVIDQMGLKAYEMRYLDELSGGELQKVMLARALAQQPKVLMLDEPTSSLDLKNQYEVMALVQRIAKSSSLCVIIVIHDLNLALRYCDRFLFIKDSHVFSYGGAETVNCETIRQVYGLDVAIEKVAGFPTVVPLTI